MKVKIDKYGYEITPRPDVIGGGWRLRLLANDEEVGGGVHPVTATKTVDDAYADALSDGEAWLQTRPTDDNKPADDDNDLSSVSL